MLFSLWFTLIKITFVAIAWCRKSLNTQVWTIYHCYIKLAEVLNEKSPFHCVLENKVNIFDFCFLFALQYKVYFWPKGQGITNILLSDRYQTKRSEEKHEYIKWLDRRRSKWRVQSEHHCLHRGESRWVKQGKIDFYFYNHYCRSPPY